MSRSLRTSAKNPITGKVQVKTISLNKFESEEEAQKFLKEWRESIKGLKPKKETKFTPKKEILNSSEITELEFKPFKPEFDFTTGNTWLLLGSSKSGKSTCMLDYYNRENEKYKDSVNILFAGNVQAKIYDDGDKKLIKTHIYENEIIKTIVKIQRGTKNKYKFLLMFDDIVDHSTKDSETMKKLITSYRNSVISSFISLQAPKLINRVNRGNINLITFHAFRNDEQAEDIIKQFLNSKKPFKGLKMDEKINLYHRLTANYQFIVLDTLKNEIYLSKCNI